MNQAENMQNISSYEAADGLLDDRVILISGVTDGIGRALAVKCAALGATTILLGRKVPRLESLHDEIVEAGGPQPGIYPFNLETTEWAEYEKITDLLLAEYGRLDGLVHCAGMLGELSPIEHHDPHLWYRVLQVNLNAPFLLTRAGMPLLRKSADPSVVFVSSTVGRKGRAHWGAYSASKFAIEGLAQVLADETENIPMRVNTINPGATRTKIRRTAFPAEDAGQSAQPDEVLAPFLYFLGPDSRGVSNLSVDSQPKN